MKSQIKQICKKRNEPDWLIYLRIKSYNKLISENNTNDIIFKKELFLNDLSIVKNKKNLINYYPIIVLPIYRAIETYEKILEEYLSLSEINNLNNLGFQDGVFIYAPKDCKNNNLISISPFIDSENRKSIEKTLIVLEENSELNILDGCTSPIKNDNNFHSYVVEFNMKSNTKLNYYSIQNLYFGKKDGIINVEDKVFNIIGDNVKLNYIQVDIGSLKNIRNNYIKLNNKECYIRNQSLVLNKEFQESIINNNYNFLNDNNIVYQKNISIQNENSKIYEKNIINSNNKGKYFYYGLSNSCNKELRYNSNSKDFLFNHDIKNINDKNILELSNEILEEFPKEYYLETLEIIKTIYNI
jgi:hypothetical protein